MTGYPEDTAGEFPPPPREFVDGEDRRVRLRESHPGRDGLVGMYLDFAPEDRAQGIPPAKEPAIRDWLETVTGPDCLSVVAVVDRTVGHAVLVPDGDESYELAIFVLQEYQSAGIGTELLRTLLGLAQAEGVERVWLTVERWNDAAVRVYETVGFETVEEAGLELEMSVRI